MTMNSMSAPPGRCRPYIGYFANRYGEQSIVTCDRGTGVASLGGGDVGPDRRQLPLARAAEALALVRDSKVMGKAVLV